MYFKFATENLFGLAKKTREDERNISGYKPLENYGIIGNMETVALVANDGSIDWMCLPHLESKSVFGRLLDKDKGGFFSVNPRTTFSSYQAYDGHTNILKTNFECPFGSGQVIDFMPPFKRSTSWHKQQLLFRKISCYKGYVPFRLVFHPRFNYGAERAKITESDTGIIASFKDERIYLDARLPFRVSKDAAESEFTLSENETIWIVMQYGTRSKFSTKEMERYYRETFSFWEKWRHKCDPIQQCVFNGPWHDLVIRSGLVLKLLTHGETGTIAAAATTSLPEVIGGIRN